MTGTGQMRAVVCRAFGPPETLALETVPAPLPGPGQVVVAVKAIGLNFTDLLAVEGRSQLRREPPLIPGTEVAGTIAALGAGVTAFGLGQRVLGTRVHVAYAERAAFGLDEILPIPDEMNFETAADFFIASMTSRYALVERAKLKAGESLLVLGAGSGAGLAAIEIGKALGARLVGAASSADKLAIARSRGVDETVLYPREALDLDGQKRFCAALRAAAGPGGEAPLGIGSLSTLSGSAGYDVVYDAVGGSYAEPALRALAWEGRYLSVGFAAGVPTLSLGPLLFKNAQIMGIQPAADEHRLPGRNPAATRQMLDWHRAGKLRPEITEIYPLERAGEALRRLKDRQAMGRIVIVTDGIAV